MRSGGGMSLSEKLGYARTQFRELGAAGAIHYKLARLWGRIFPRRAPYALRARRAEAPVWVRPASSDLMVFDQIFVEREYRGLDDVTEADFIIDCGANVGYSSVYLLSRFPKARLVAIEPERTNFEALRRNMAAFGDRVTCLHAGVWSHPAGVVFDAPEKPWLSAVENIVIELHGADCRAALHRAIDGLGFAITTCGELTVCKRRILFAA